MYTIEDLRNGKCAVINDGTLEELREVLKLAYIQDNGTCTGSFKYYFFLNNQPYEHWNCNNKTNKPTQSVKDFLKKENMQTNVSNNSNDPFDVYKPVQISRRDFFTAMAMQGIISNDTTLFNSTVVANSVKYADDLIAELDKPRKKISVK